MRFAFATALFLLLTGCEREGPHRHERAQVVSLPYVPASRSSTSGVGVDPENGHVVVVGGESSSPAVYGVVLRCPHGKFATSGSDEWHERLWKSLREDEWVDVEYVEILDDRGKVVRMKTTAITPDLEARAPCSWHPKIPSKPSPDDLPDYGWAPEDYYEASL